MLSYNKWDQFDDEKALQDIDDNQLANEHRKKLISKNQESLISALRKGEALKSKVAVEKLKQKKLNQKSTRKDQTVTAAINEIENDNSQFSLGLALTKVSKFLNELLIDIEKILVFTEKKCLHFDGFRLALISLLKILKFNQMRNIFLEVSKSQNLKNLDKTFDELKDAELFILDQIINCLVLFSLSNGMNSLAIELSRSYIKRHDDSFGMWIMRGIGFYRLGNPYLGHLHLNKAYQVDPLYPGLSETINKSLKLRKLFINEQMSSILKDQISLDFEKSILTFFDTRNTLLFSSPNLSAIHENMIDFEFEVLNQNYNLTPDYNSIFPEIKWSNFFNKFIKAILWNFSNFETNSSNTYIRFLEKAKQKFSISSTDNSISNENLNKLIVFFGFLLAQKIYYDGQILFLEGAFHHAEVKYFTVIFLLEELLDFLRLGDSFDKLYLFEILNVDSLQEIDKIERYFTNILAQSYLNLITARIHTSSIKSNSIFKVLEFRIENVDFFSDIMFCERSLKLNPSFIGYFKKMKLLYALKRYKEAYDYIEQIIESSKCFRQEPLMRYIVDHGISPEFSQLFISGFFVEFNSVDICFEPLSNPSAINKEFKDIILNLENLHLKSSFLSKSTGVIPTDNSLIASRKWLEIYENFKEKIVYKCSQLGIKLPCNISS